MSHIVVGQGLILGLRLRTQHRPALLISVVPQLNIFLSAVNKDRQYQSYKHRHNENQRLLHS